MNKRELRLDKFGITKHRYLELKHFCNQFQDWKEEIVSKQSTLIKSPSFDSEIHGKGKTSDIVGDISTCRAATNIEIVERTAKQASEKYGKDFYKWIIENVCYDVPVTYMITKQGMPLNKYSFYDLRRYFFYLLDINKTA